MDTTINLPLYQMPDGGVIDLRIVRAVGPMGAYHGGKDYFRIYYNQDQGDTFEGELHGKIK